jgi:hypothetical protein
MKRLSRCARALCAAAGLAAPTVLALAPREAAAQMAHIPNNDWRQADRQDAIAAATTKPGFTFELRFGPYLPDIDKESTFAGKTLPPFDRVFGLDCSGQPAKQTGVSHRLYFGLEADYLPIRIPYIGGLGIGAGWGFTRFSNQAAFSGKTPSGVYCSAETTSLTIMPMHGSIVLRVDELMRRTRIPIVPYGKIGAGVAFWRAADDSGTEQICGSSTSSHKCKTGETPFAYGAGFTPSLHLAVGGMLSLNFLEPRSTARLNESAGLSHVYAFGEFFSDGITFGSNVLKVGTTSWVAGLAVDL